MPPETQRPLVEAVTRGPQGSCWGRVPLAPVGAGEARVRVLLAGICRTDLQAAEGQLRVDEGRVLGHEFVGVVTEAGPGCALAPGARVTATPLLPCGACEGCARGEGCDRPSLLGVQRDGVFAAEAVLPAGALHEVPATLPLKRAAYVEPVAAALAVFNAPIRPGQRGVLVGKNRIAELTRRLLVARGFASITHVDEGEPLPADRFDFAIETVATTATVEAMLRAVRPRGCIVLKSRPATPVALDVALAVRRELRLQATGYGSFREAIALLAELPVDDLLGAVFPLAHHRDAFAQAARSESAKLFLEPG